MCIKDIQHKLYINVLQKKGCKNLNSIMNSPFLFPYAILYLLPKKNQPGPSPALSWSSS